MEIHQCQSFNVLFAKSSLKKKKSYADGVLTLSAKLGTSSFQAVLRSEAGELAKKLVPSIEPFQSGTTVSFSMYEVQIEDIISPAEVQAIPLQAHSNAKYSSTLSSKAVRKRAESEDDGLPSKVPCVGVGKKYQSAYRP